jgi:hypothetical protein
MSPIEIDWERCPGCGDAVDFAWETGDAFGRMGFIPQRHNALIADWVFHSGCWDDLIKREFPPDGDTTRAQE